MGKAIFILIVLLAFNPIYGQNEPRTLLWKVTKKGQNTESYLFGTFHEVSPTFFDSLSNVVNKLHESDILFVEEAALPENQLRMQEASAWNFKSWKAILTDEQEIIFRDFVEKIADSTCYTQSPLQLSFSITSFNLMNCESILGFTELMDHHIEDLALKEAKQVLSLDINHNIIFDRAGESLSKQQDSLYAAYCVLGMKSILDSNVFDCEFIVAYRNLDINYELDIDLEQNYFNKSFLIDRNNNWTAILDKAFTSGNCFVAVGYKHLCYKQGLIQQLRKIGYEVTPVPVRL